MTDSTEAELLSRLLEKAGWQEVDVDRYASHGLLSCAFTSAYALLGFVLSPSTHIVLGSWADSQAALMEIAKDDAMAHLKDHYLVFFVTEIEDADREGLRRVTDDTHECRKTCIETRDRTLDAVLAELPFVSAVVAENRSLLDDEEEPDAELAAAGLNSRLLGDLGKRSAIAILDRWLEGTYCQERETDASEEH